MRKKSVTYDGASFVIAPLNLNQVDAFIENREVSDDQQVMRARQLDVILAGLNNAQPEKPWTVETLKDELDLTLMTMLMDDILAFSGLQQVKAKQTGEA